MRALFFLIIFSLPCWGTIYLTVSGANVKRAKIAMGQVHPMADSASSDLQLAKNIREQLKSDLLFSNLFDFISDSDFSKSDLPQDYNKVSYEEFSTAGAAFALKLAYQVSGGKLTVEAYLYDVPGQKKIFGKKYQSAVTQYYRLVHTLSEDILGELTGEKGLFTSRILMTCWKYPYKSPPPKEIYVVDPDGRNLTQLTSDRTLSTTPTWMQDGKNITYSQYEWVNRGGLRTRGVVLKKHDLTTGKRQFMSAKEGMNSGAAWSANSSQGVVTLSFTGRPELYFLGRDGGEAEPLSRNIQWKRLLGDGFQSNQSSLLFDVEASWAPDGKRIVFSSARTGHPMIYVLDMATKIANQLTFAGQYNASPSWSPRGDKILFAAQRTGEGNFDIYMIDPDGNNLTRMTAGESRPRRINSENPSWAPTGRHFAFSNNEEGHYSVYVMTVDSTHKTKISPPDKECFSPSWGPNEG
jgi:TolB protein